MVIQLWEHFKTSEIGMSRIKMNHVELRILRFFWKTKHWKFRSGGSLKNWAELTAIYPYLKADWEQSISISYNLEIEQNNRGE